ncbi:MAG: HAD family hydrolase [Sulfurospirillaceae bacterium]|nr:HAD family hydrolase [Sulfurospirillaceae bacterium]MDD2826276.1 HAD family hydrolase [Sulfurospirillaceae bacterium]
MTQKACIIFDMDGTLIDSSRAMTASVNYVRHTLGLEPIEKSFLEYYINQPDQHLPKIFYNTDVYNPAHRELFKEHYLESTKSMISLYPDVHELLEALHAKATLNIATNANDIFARHMLSLLGIQEYFTCILGANNVKAPKPEPDMIDTIIELTSSTKSETILVGDSVKDEYAARNAHVNFIFADWGYGTSETALQRAGDIKELKVLLQKVIL